jgi:hypothetical protein
MPGLAAVGVFLLLALRDAGYQPTLWYPIGLFLLALLAIVLLTGNAVRPGGNTLVALAAFAVFTAWCFASIRWSGVRGDALEGANKTLVYLVVLALFALMPVPRGLAVALLGLFSTGTGLIALATVARAQASEDPASFFVDGRLAEPAGYPNAAAALFLASYWPALALAGRRGLPPLLRGVLTAAATALLGTAVLCQSRGSVVAFLLVCLLQLALLPGRGRSIATLALTGGAVAATLPLLLDVYPALAEESVAAPVRSALLALLAATAATGLAGWLLARLDERVEIADARARRLDRLAVAAAAVAVLGALVWTATAVEAPLERMTAAWDGFAGNQEPSRSGSHLTSGLGSNRHDFWRVALHSFSERPLTGIGIDNFAAEYVRDRRSDEEPLHPHSLEVRVLSQTGVVGSALFVLFLGAAAWACLRARGRRPLERVALLGGVTGTTYWLVHGSVDWLWEFPGLTAPALAWIGLAGNGTFAPADPRGILASRSLVGPAVVCTSAAALVLAAPWLAEQHIRTAASSWPADPGRALALLDRARRLDPLTAEADLAAGVIASRRGDVAGMRAAFGRAVERQPSNWFAHLELALGAAESGDRGLALAHIRRARSLNPRDGTLKEVENALERREQVDRRALEDRFVERVRSLSR